MTQYDFRITQHNFRITQDSLSLSLSLQDDSRMTQYDSKMTQDVSRMTLGYPPDGHAPTESLILSAKTERGRQERRMVGRPGGRMALG